MRATAAVFVSLVASAVAYQVTTPSATSGWTTGGPNTLAWDRVDSDRLNFTAVLVNQDRSVLPTNNEVLAALVDGTKGSITVSAPSGGWPVGSAFQVNLVQDSSDVNTILAQSAQFNITSSGSSSSSGASTTTAASSSTGTTLVVSSTGTASGDLNPTTSLTSTSPSQSSGALPALNVQSAFFGVLAFLGAFLA